MPMRRNSSYEKLISALKSLPIDTEIGWHDPALREDGLIDSWVDVYSPILCDSLNIPLAWVVDSKGSLKRDSLRIRVKPTEQVFVSFYGQTVKKNAWSPYDVTQAVEKWVQGRSGRKDLTVSWDPSIGISPLVLKLLQDPDSGSVVMGKGVTASRAYFESFIQRELEHGIQDKQREDNQREQLE